LYSDHQPLCVIFLISPVEIQVNTHFNYGSKEKSSSKKDNNQKGFKKEIIF
jgi:hypothetical protein